MTYPGQKMIVTESLLFRKIPIHNINLVVKILNHEIQYDLLKNAFDKITNLYDSLYFKIEKNNTDELLIKTDKPNVKIELKETNFCNDQDLNREISAYLEVPLLTGDPELIRLIILKNNNDTFMLLSFHHAICDLKSIESFIQDLDNAYFLLKSNLNFSVESAEFEQIKSRYVKKNYHLFGEIHQEWSQSKQAQESETYWKNALSEIPIPLHLNSDYPRQGENINFKTKFINLNIDNLIYEKCKKITQEIGVNTFEFFHSVFKYFIYSISNKKEFIITTPATLRRLGSFNYTLGYFSNLLPIPCKINLDQSIKEFILDNKKSLDESIRHKNFPYSKICELLKVGRGSPNGETLDEVRFVYQRLSRENSKIGSSFAVGKENNRVDIKALSLENKSYEKSYGLHDFSMMLFDCNTEINGKIEYRSDLFKQKTIDMWMASFKHILNQFIDHHEHKLNTVTFTEKENDSILYPEIPNHSENIALDKHLNILFEESVRNFPNHIAIKYIDKSLSYQELNILSNYYANTLNELGVFQGEMIGIYVDRSLSFPIAMLAILKIGCTYVPIDYANPSERLETILLDTKMRFVFSEKDQIKKIEGLYTIEIDLKRNSEILYQPNINVKNHSIHKNTSDVAYVIFTSGSTGKPKGVMLTHKNVTELFKSCFQYFNLLSTDHWSVFHSFAFDFSVWEIWGALLTGSQATIVPKDLLYDPKHFLNFLSLEKISILNQTPSVFKNLLSAWNEHETKNSYSLRYIIFGGESLESNALINWYKLKVADHVELINMYGTTEVAVHMTYFKLNRDLICKKENQLKSFIGKPLSHLKMMIMNDNLKIVPKGSCGEICIVGSSVSLGYLNREEQTALKFVKYHNERLYRTGDLGVINSDHILEYLGRKDGQIKLRGYRIETNDIYNNLIEMNVFQNCFIKLQNYNGNQNIVCYFVKYPDQTVALDMINNTLKSKIPSYMIPSKYIELNEIPININGKIDHHLLDKIYLSQVLKNDELSQNINIENYNYLENSIKNIWEHILKIKDPSLEMNFFDLGGNSLHLVHLQNKLNALIGSEKVEILDLFKYSNIQNQAKYLQTLIPSVTLEHDERKQNSVSYGQYSLWQVHQTIQNNYSYNITFAFKVTKEINIKKFLLAVSQTVNRYPILSTTYHYSEQNLTQQSNEKKLFCDLQTYSNVIDKKSLDDILTKNSRYRYHLAKDELVRIHVINTPNNNNDIYIQFVIHHIVMDMRSMQIFLNQIFETYSQSHPAKECENFSYFNYIEEEKNNLSSDSFQKSLSFYKKKLFQEAPAPFVIKSHQNKNEIKPRGKKLLYTLSEKLTEEIKALSEQKFNLLLSSYILSLNKMYGSSDLCVTVPNVNRTQEKYKNTMGYFHDPSLYRIKIQDDHSMGSIINEIEEYKENELKNGHVPSFLLQSEYRNHYQHHTNHLSYTLFVFYDEKYSDLTGTFLQTDHASIHDQFEPVQVDTQSSLFDIAMQVFENQKNIVIEVQYDQSIVSDLDAKKIIDFYEQNIINYFTKEQRDNLSKHKMDFSLFYFASNEANQNKDIYNLLFSGSQFADENHFAAVWIPERHFHPFGGIYPNASILASALAVKTSQIQIRSGSCVLPLHHPARVVEEWSVVDILSKGRVGLSFAPGWNPADFIYSANRYENRKEELHSSIKKVQDLWQGKTLSFLDKEKNEFQIETYPKPVQKNLPIWITAYGNPETFSYAGENGFYILTHLLGQDIEKLSENIKIYQKSFLQNQNQHKNFSQFKVTVMLHTFLDQDEHFVRKTIEKPFKDYIRTGIHSLKQTLLKEIDPQKFSTADIDVVIQFAFDRYFKEAALFGSKESVAKMLHKLSYIGVSEVACLIDFGVDEKLVLNSLKLLNEVRETF